MIKHQSIIHIYKTYSICATMFLTLKAKYITNVCFRHPKHYRNKSFILTFLVT